MPDGPPNRGEWEDFSTHVFKLCKNMAEVTIQFCFFITSQLSFGKETTNAHLNYVGFNFWLNFKCSPLPPSVACFPGSEIPLPQLKYFPGTRYLLQLRCSLQGRSSHRIPSAGKSSQGLTQALSPEGGGSHTGSVT